MKTEKEIRASVAGRARRRLQRAAHGVLIASFFVVTAVAVAQSPAASASRLISLEQSLHIGLENNVQVELSEAQLEQALLSLEQARATNLVQPSPVTLLQAEAGLESARQQIDLAHLQVSIEIESDYYNVLRLQNLMTVVEEGLALAQRYEEIARQRIAVGSGTRADLFAAEAEVAARKAELEGLSRQYEVTLLKFQMSVGMTDVVPEPLEVVVTPPPTVELDKAVQRALENRVELAQLRTGVRVAEKNVELATNDYTPGLTRDQAEVELKLSRLQLQQAVEGIELEVRTAHQSMRDSWGHIEVAEKQAASAEELLRTTEATFSAELATQVEVMEAQAAVTSARSEAINAYFDARLAQAEFFQAIALLPEERDRWAGERDNHVEA